MSIILNTKLQPNALYKGDDQGSKEYEHEAGSQSNMSYKGGDSRVTLTEGLTSHKIMKWLSGHKSQLLNYLTILINLIVMSVLLASTTSKIKELDGVVNGQRILWNDFLNKFPDISLAYRQVEETTDQLNLIKLDLDRSNVTISQLKMISLNELTKLNALADNIDPLSERISLYNRILDHNISSTDLKITKCQTILVSFGLRRDYLYNSVVEELLLKLFSDCKYQLCGDKVMRVLSYSTDKFNAKMCLDDNTLVRYNNGEVVYKTPLVNISRQIGLRFVCQKFTYPGHSRGDSMWFMSDESEYSSNTNYFTSNLPEYYESDADC